LDYYEITKVLRNKDKTRFLSTIEFFPEEGKYHFDGHRLCGIRFSPEESKRHKNMCPKCGRPLTIGVMHRVAKLADRPEGFIPPNSIPFKNLIPLLEVIAEAKGVKEGSQTVEREYRQAIARFGNEFAILLEVPEDDLRQGLNPRVVEGIVRARAGKVFIKPGFDGEYGTIQIFNEGEVAQSRKEEQLSFF
jgi:PHP family Zn ribbon phosphoesterase